MTVNISKIRISQMTAEVAEPLVNGQAVVFQGRAVVDEVRQKDNQDGSVDQTAIAKIEFVDVKGVDGGSITQSIKVQSSIRDGCFAVATTLGESPESLYRQVKEMAVKWLNEYEDKKMGRLE